MTYILDRLSISTEKQRKQHFLEECLEWNLPVGIYIILKISTLMLLCWSTNCMIKMAWNNWQKWMYCMDSSSSPLTGCFCAWKFINVLYIHFLNIYVGESVQRCLRTCLPRTLKVSVPRLLQRSKFATILSIRRRRLDSFQNLIYLQSFNLHQSNTK